MTREIVLERMTQIFRDIFDDESINVVDATHADDIEDWDSLEHINLVLAVEEEFDIKFTLPEVTDAKNVGDIVDIIVQRGTL
ncbi:MAG: acyl carrier protein [Defluviitaleaceae bacterium]|nr:acyl carrier protein [Defluviitaleaceae bacterium]MCL2238357.1 acyl carrier protein [Defluviitaleaceae bacterium]